MIYTLPYQSETLLKKSYLKIRAMMDPDTDLILVSSVQSQLEDRSTEDIYKKILKLEGLYRDTNDAWTSPPAKVRVIHQL